MKSKMILFLLILSLVLQMMISVPSLGESDLGSEESTKLYVTANLLNGRANPRKTATIEARFDHGDDLEPTGDWSDDHHWIEVRGGETLTVWVYIDYVTERKTEFKAKNTKFKKVKIRSRPIDGKLQGYLKKGKTVTITRVVLGWGRCSKGWIDMSYLEEVEP